MAIGGCTNAQAAAISEAVAAIISISKFAPCHRVAVAPALRRVYPCRSSSRPPQSMPGSYDPADSGLAKYFLAMLDDADRNNQYSKAIKACIDEFKANNKGKAPTVLDIKASVPACLAACASCTARST